MTNVEKTVLAEFDGKFKCIQNDCDGGGAIPYQVVDGEWSAEQCQFHAEYLFPLKTFLKDALKLQRESVVEEEYQRGRRAGIQEALAMAVADVSYSFLDTPEDMRQNIVLAIKSLISH